MENETTKVTDIELKEQGATIVFGANGLKNKTPDWMGKISNGIIFAGLFWAMFSSQITEIPDPIKADITRWVMILGGFVKLATKFFGLKIPNVD